MTARVHIIRQFAIVGALFGASCFGTDLPRSPRVALVGIQSNAENGRLEHALRAVDTYLGFFPGDPHLLQMRENILAARERWQGIRGPAAGGNEPEPIVSHAAQFGRDFTLPEVELALLWVEPGRLVMADLMDSDNDTVVVLTHGYWLGRTEVTQEQWRRVMESEPSPSFFSGSQRPVECVTWSSALAFCRKLTERERAAGRLPDNYEYSLPTEAQWEFACRAGATTPFAGDPGAMAWHAGNSSRRTHPVAQKQPNAWGFYDMHGNVWEWCLDGFADYPGGHSVDPRPNHHGPSAVEHRMSRGGAWNAYVGCCRADFRLWNPLNALGAAFGFRLALVRVQ